MTPVHSPHHSVTSSASSRTPVHVLTIHEYRKQQHTPTLSRTGTPSGKTLRRKPAALALNDIERAPSVSHSTRSDSGPPLRPLHFSQSAYQLNSIAPPPQQPTLLELSLRSQSAEPRVQTGSISSISTGNSSSKMAPKRAVYGDFRAAHAGILRRPEDEPEQSHMELPLEPSPAALSPNSSSYTSPPYSPESVSAPSPLTIKPPARESRFSLKGLTRTLTKKLTKTPSALQGEELQEMRSENVSKASISMEGEFPRPLHQTYITTPETSYFPVGPMSPATPSSPLSPEGFHAFTPAFPQAFSPGQNEAEASRGQSAGLYQTDSLASMLPDEHSTEIGRLDESHLPYSTEGGFSKPYYDDLDSIYPSSSIYTADGHRKSMYQQGLQSDRNSSGNPFARLSGINASDFANEYNPNSSYDYGDSNRMSRQLSRPFAQDMYHPSVEERDPKTDTISKLIDEYSPHDAANAPMATHYEGKGKGVQQTGSGSRRPPITQHPGSPPREAAPLAPAFEYDEAPFVPPRLPMSGMFSDESRYSYGDTRNLLRISESDVSFQPAMKGTLEPSSSYSQPEARTLEPSSSYSQGDNPQSPHTPREALEQAEQIFQDTANKHQDDRKIPAMWARRNSASLMLSKSATNRSSGVPEEFDTPLGGGDAAITGDKADWETVGGNSRDSKGHESLLSSIADYSSSEGTRNSLGLNSDGSLPSWAKLAQSPARSTYYNHPSPSRTQNPQLFGSSPPQLRAQASVRTAPDTSSPPLATSPPASRTAPLFQFATQPEDVRGRGAVDQPYAYAPWADPYAFSDKETQELLASGPNDNIIIDEQRASSVGQSQGHYRCRSDDSTLPTSSTADESVFDNSPIGLERQNTFEKLSYVGPKGNLTGTPRGTGMHETGSSVADTSSPGVKLSSSVGRQSVRSDYTGFYASPFPATGSVTRISQSRPVYKPSPEHRTPSEASLFSQTPELETVQETSPNPGARKHLRNSTTFLRQQRRTSRSAVPGQTKLRQMFLAPEAARSTISTQDTHITRFVAHSDRPSTSDTTTPLRPTHPSLDIYPAPVRTNIAHQHSPHLLCVEREPNPEDEARRRKLSWCILMAFCLLPPCIILFRFIGDKVIAELTKGHLGHVTPQSKRTALIAGIVVNVGLVTAILVPVLVAQALKAA
ncbi:hypothetical protein J4E85_009107 [Alternaria conjuncta]|uniref:uncharacterized protein n=1 Tax=Alternaria conjuncta TaxID=181017 RepID=UPI00221FD4F2|nr:uncharacterized protein J4E85_009107 [Alternaria conjuncta]KAI4920992.1 hypothetical protein J4E85_009107 [Alternaria conjuncta]